MAELTADEVRRMAAAVGLLIGHDDLVDVTFRVNVTFEVLGGLDSVDLPGTPPDPYLSIPGVQDLETHESGEASSGV